eukprot:GHVN01060466.1.p1 GENE.GHVN01060466.1~~GHVN01060466.1.p1  ORF type:complete len:691 (+),score=148.60 GHVN01060466.1:1-2073(+)
MYTPSILVPSPTYRGDVALVLKAGVGHVVEAVILLVTGSMVLVGCGWQGEEWKWKWVSFLPLLLFDLSIVVMGLMSAKRFWPYILSADRWTSVRGISVVWFRFLTLLFALIHVATHSETRVAHHLSGYTISNLTRSEEDPDVIALLKKYVAMHPTVGLSGELMGDTPDLHDETQFDYGGVLRYLLPPEPWLFMMALCAIAMTAVEAAINAIVKSRKIWVRIAAFDLWVSMQVVLIYLKLAVGFNSSWHRVMIPAYIVFTQPVLASVCCVLAALVVPVLGYVGVFLFVQGVGYLYVINRSAAYLSGSQVSYTAVAIVLTTQQLLTVGCATLITFSYLLERRVLAIGSPASSPSVGSARGGDEEFLLPIPRRGVSVSWADESHSSTGSGRGGEGEVGDGGNGVRLVKNMRLKMEQVGDNFFRIASPDEAPLAPTTLPPQPTGLNEQIGEASDGGRQDTSNEVVRGEDGDEKGEAISLGNGIHLNGRCALASMSLHRTHKCDGGDRDGTGQDNTGSGFKQPTQSTRATASITRSEWDTVDAEADEQAQCVEVRAMGGEEVDELEEDEEEVTERELSGGLCYLCESQLSSAVFLYCGHGGVCAQCARKVFYRNGICPTCRHRIEAVSQYSPTMMRLASASRSLIREGDAEIAERRESDEEVREGGGVSASALPIDTHVIESLNISWLPQWRRHQ